MFSAETNNLVQRLLCYKVPGAKATQFPVVRVCERLRGPLCELAGVEGYRWLLGRAITFASGEAPIVGPLRVTANGSLEGFEEMAAKCGEQRASEIGVLLTTQLLGLFLTLFGTDQAIRLFQDLYPDLTITGQPEKLTPFADILKEVDNLNSLSARLEAIAEKYPDAEEALLSISGNIRNTATTLEVLARIKAKSGKAPAQSQKPYLM